jgi:hypothetical protein
MARCRHWTGNRSALQAGFSRGLPGYERNSVCVDSTAPPLIRSRRIIAAMPARSRRPLCLQ